MSVTTITSPGYRFVEKKPEIVVLQRFAGETSCGRDRDIEAAVLKEAGFDISYARLMKGSDGKFYISSQRHKTTISESDVHERIGESTTDIFSRVAKEFEGRPKRVMAHRFTKETQGRDHDIEVEVLQRAGLDISYAKLMKGDDGEYYVKWKIVGGQIFDSAYSQRTLGAWQDSITDIFKEVMKEFNERDAQK